MKRKLKYFAVALILLLLSAGIWVYYIANYKPSFPVNNKIPQALVTKTDTATFFSGNSWLHKRKEGFWELYVEGTPLERGARIGVLTQPLIEKQEDAFVEQIKQMIPSNSYLKFLRYFIGFFNRKLGEAIPEEYKEEIFAVSSYSSKQYSFIGTPYQRQMNYHAAHDIGHALQSMGMVGCTSFASWGANTKDSSLLVGRNFDFYVGDKFAEDKIIAFISPSEGYKHMFVTWGGMIGVVSGMNEKGLTVTLNASNTKIPFKSATPVSIIGREILQYAANIEQALNIAKRRSSFVSEQFLISSVTDGIAVVIEKTPKTTEVYKTGENQIISTNHFQTEQLSQNKDAIYQKENTASGYRYERLSELLTRNKKLTPAEVASILRDTKGKNGENIGLGNEKAINQLIAHHSIIFSPQKKMVWISTAPFQSGEYIAYNLDSVFYGKQKKNGIPLPLTAFNIPADSAFLQKEFPAFRKYRKAHFEMVRTGRMSVAPDSIIAFNPNYYQSYVDAGNLWLTQGDTTKAANSFNMALKREIATLKEKKEIEKLINTCNK